MSSIESILAAALEQARRAEPHELRELQAALASRLEAEAGLGRRDAAREARLAQFEQLVLSLAHDLRNPLNILLASLALLRRGPMGAAPREAELIATMETEIRGAEAFIRRLVDCIKDPTVERSRFDLAALVREVCAAVPRLRTFELVFESPERPCEVTADPQILRCLIHHALRQLAQASSATAGTVTVALTAEPAQDVISIRLNADSESSGNQSPPFNLALFGVEFFLCRQRFERSGGWVEGIEEGTAVRIGLPHAPRHPA